MRRLFNKPLNDGLDKVFEVKQQKHVKLINGEKIFSLVINNDVPDRVIRTETSLMQNTTINDLFLSMIDMNLIIKSSNSDEISSLSFVDVSVEQEYLVNTSIDYEPDESEIPEPGWFAEE